MCVPKCWIIHDVQPQKDLSTASVYQIQHAFNLSVDWATRNQHNLKCTYLSAHIWVHIFECTYLSAHIWVHLIERALIWRPFDNISQYSCLQVDLVGTLKMENQTNPLIHVTAYCFLTFTSYLTVCDCIDLWSFLCEVWIQTLFSILRFVFCHVDCNCDEHWMPKQIQGLSGRCWITIGDR